MSQDRESVIPDSTYPPLEAPGEFKSQIPDHLLGNATPTEKHLMEEASISRQQNAWLVKACLSLDRQTRLTNGRLRKAEQDIRSLKDDRKTIVRGWRFVAAVVAGIGGLIGFGLTVWDKLSG